MPKIIVAQGLEEPFELHPRGTTLLVCCPWEGGGIKISSSAGVYNH